MSSSSSITKVTKHQQLSEVLRRELVRGDLKPGDAMPSQNVLAEQHNVSVTTVREALSALAEQGFIERIQGKGTFVKQFDLHRPVARARQIGLVSAHLELPYHAEFTHWIESTIRDNNFSLVLNSWSHFSDDSRASIRRLLREMDGVIVGPIDDAKMLAYILDGEPAPNNLVTFAAPEPVDSHYVTVMMSIGVIEAVEHLVDLGHRRIGLLTGEPEIYPFGRRVGFATALKQFDLAPESCPVVYGERLSYRQVAYRLAQDLLADREKLPTALIVHNDNAAFGVFRALREAGLSVPEDISLVGCDNVSISQYAPTPLTTIDLRIRDVAQIAGQIMAEVLEEPTAAREIPHYKQIKLSSRLIVRESTARVARS